MNSSQDVLNGRYRLKRRLGVGAMGSVWEAFDTYLERTVAVKKLVPGSFGDENAATRRERIRREAIAIAQVEHPVIVTVHDLISVGRDKVPWIVMGYVPGRPLSEIIHDRKDEPLSERKVAAIALAVLDGLRACHASRVYHRDVKPGNIILGPDGSVHLVDFGIARIVGEVPLTDDGKLVGTPAFLAPELLDGEPAGPGTDLWALGVTLYYALVGRAPFWAETTWAMLSAIKFRNPPEPREGGPLANLVLQMLRKRPEDRPDAGTVAAILRGVASQPDRPAGQSYWTGPQPSAEQRDGYRASSQEQSVRTWTNAQPIRPEKRLTALSGLPVLTQAQVVAGMPTDRAASELLALPKRDAARIIKRCDEVLGGNLLSAIAIPGESSAGEPDASERAATVRKILQMLPPDRHGPLLDHMSSVALAAVLAVPPAEETARIVEHADTATVVGALSEMTPVRAAPLVTAMDAGYAAEVLRRVAPARVADIMRNVVPASLRNELLSRLPDGFRDAVRRHTSV